jgi:hypothetical protein
MAPRERLKECALLLLLNGGSVPAELDGEAMAWLGRRVVEGKAGEESERELLGDAELVAADELVGAAEDADALLAVGVAPALLVPFQSHASSPSYGVASQGRMRCAALPPYASSQKWPALQAGKRSWMSLRRGIERRAARGKDATGQLLGGGNEMQKESDEIEVRGEPVAEEEKGWKEERTTRSGSDGSAWHGRHAAPRLLRATATGARLPRWPQRGPPAKIVLPGAMRCKLLLYRCGRPCSCERPRGVRG